MPGSLVQVVQGSFLGGFPRFAGAGPVSRTAVPLPPTARFAPMGGQPLAAAIQAKMEDLFRSDFSAVRVHVGPQVASLGATALTQGPNLYFAPGQYAPTTPHGLRLLGHELAHVVQQRQGRVSRPPGTGWMVIHDPGLEAEAERFGLKAGVLAVPAVAVHSPAPLRPLPVAQPMKRAVSRGLSFLKGPKIHKNVVVKHNKRAVYELDFYDETRSLIGEEKSGKGLESLSYYDRFDHVKKSSKQMIRVLDSIDRGHDEVVTKGELVKIAADKYVLAYATRDYGVLKLAAQRLAGMKNTPYSHISWGIVMGHPTGDDIDESKVIWIHEGD